MSLSFYPAILHRYLIDIPPKPKVSNDTESPAEVKDGEHTTVDALQKQNDSERNDNINGNGNVEKEGDNTTCSPPSKRQKKASKPKGGQNKGRPRTVPKVADHFRICPTVHHGTECKFGDRCRFAHDVVEYLKKKPKDVGEDCVNYKVFGKCKYGVECRFAKQHLDKDTNANLVNEELYQQTVESMTEADKKQNVLSKELMNRLRKRQFKYEKTAKYLAKMTLKDTKPSTKPTPPSIVSDAPGGVENGVTPPEATTESVTTAITHNIDAPHATIGCVTDEDLIKLRPCEKKKVLLHPFTLYHIIVDTYLNFLET